MALRRKRLPDDPLWYVSMDDGAIDHDARLAKQRAALESDEARAAFDTLSAAARHLVVHERFLATEDRGWLCLREDVAPSEFSLMPLTPRQRAEVRGEGEESSTGRYLAACYSLRTARHFLVPARDGGEHPLVIERVDGRLSERSQLLLGADLMEELGWAAVRLSRLSDRF